MNQGKKVSTPIPATSNNDVVTVAKEDLLNKDVTIKLIPAETRDFLKGVSLKDIFTARKSTETPLTEEPTVVATQKDTESINDIEAKIKAMYGEK
jgi:hypothetical protein